MKHAAFFGKKLLPLCLLLGFQLASATDLSLEIKVSKKEAQRGDTVSASVVLAKSNKSSASGIVVSVSLSEGLSLIFPSPEVGSFSALGQQWKIAQLSENQSSVILKFKILVDGEGPLAIQSEIVKANETDPDSFPGNMKMGEDDLAFSHVTVPIVFCGNEPVRLIAEAFPGFTGYQWLRDGVEIPGGEGRRLEIKMPGRYTCQVNETNNSDAASFPVIVRQSPGLDARLNERYSVCAGEALKLKAETRGGTPPFRFDWSNDLGWDLEKPLKAAAKLEVKVKIRDSAGCEAVAKTLVQVEACEN